MSQAFHQVRIAAFFFISAFMFSPLPGCSSSTSLSNPASGTARSENTKESASVKKIIKTDQESPEKITEKTTFAAGCFWGVEDKFLKVRGVLSTRVGYTGGSVKNPTYKQVCSDETGHAEAVEVVFDPAIVSYKELVELFFKFHDPTQVNRQGPDVGSQYRSAIFTHSEEQKEAALAVIESLIRENRYSRPIATAVVLAGEFYQAEDYHQKYFLKLKKGC